jgi:hypothetical protein
MSLSGQAAVLIWHNVLGEFRADFHEWHNREHMPERLAIAGFRRGRRYRAIEGEPEFFNLYEADGLEILSGPEYLSRLNSPTPWTKRVLPGFRDVARSICRIVHTAGVGQGGFVLTLRFEVAADQREQTTERLARTILPTVALRPGIVGAHLCLTDAGASDVVTAEATVRVVPTIVPSCAVLIEGISAAHVKSAGATVADALADTTTTAPFQAAVYYLENCQENLVSV